MKYVYPVISRRAGGVSVGVNLNPNNACNWRCIYCQVPHLIRGGSPNLDLALLEEELRALLTDIINGDFMMRLVPDDMRRLNDIALSGNGESTSAVEFPLVVDLIGRVLSDFKLTGKIKLVLITNGSLAHKTYVQEGLRKIALLNGEIWFKFDRATRIGLKKVNDTEIDPERHYQRMKTVARLCPTRIQSCFFSFDGIAPGGAEIDAWLAMLTRANFEQVPLHGVFIYGLARDSLQVEAPRLGRLVEDWMQALARQVEASGWQARVYI
jgi:wyosine [tRNA(Phe)-imidazoG37] synthetase (radical SAM superfamily)